MTKTFEEEYSEFARKKGYDNSSWMDDLKKHFNNWHSDEEYQAEHAARKAEQLARKKEYEINKDIYSKTAKKLNKAELEIASLKSQLEHQPLPEVPECVADEIYSRRYVSSSSGITPSDGLLLMEVFRDLNSSHDIIRNGISFKESKFYHWMKSSDNNKTFVEAILNGYTVQKQKQFYLKHIDMSKVDKECDWYLCTDCVKLGHEWVGKNLKPKDDDFKFTQEEIDSMNTGSYEKIEVEE